MAKLHLVIANKNYSSWSLRPWMAMTIAGSRFRRNDDTARYAGHERANRRAFQGRAGAGAASWQGHDLGNPGHSGVSGGNVSAKNLWPKTKAARAVARAISNEMHAGFTGLRNALPDEPAAAPKTQSTLNDETRADIARIEEIWRDCRKTYGKGGKFLFGKFCNADAMFAPVVTRFETYAIPVAKDTKAYMDAVHGNEGLPDMEICRPQGNLDRSVRRGGLELRRGLLSVGLERVTFPASSNSSKMPRTTAVESLLSLIISSTSIGVGDRSESTSLRSEGLASADS